MKSGLLFWLVLRASAGQTTKGVLTYSTGLRRFAWAFAVLPPTLLVSLMATSPGEEPIVSIALGTFAVFFVLASPLLIEFHFTRFHFDEEWLHVRSPWTRARALRWVDVRELQWRPVARMLHVTDGYVTLRISPLITGLEDFAKHCRSHIPGPVRRRDPEVTAVLRLMSKGRARELAFSMLPAKSLVS